MLEYSSAAYMDKIPVCPRFSFEIIEDKTTDTRCFFGKTDDSIIIIFRGTDSKINWANNFLFCKKTIPYGNNASKIRVHTGFLKNYKSIRQKLLSKIPQNPCKIKITGHSMGAALAVLCGVDIQYNLNNADIEVYLFGCPAVGNRAFAKSYDKRVFKTLRISNGNDIITKLPPFFLGYRHVGINLHTGMLSLPFVVSAREHYPKSYYKSLWENL